MTEDNPIMINEIDVSECKRLITNKIYGYVCNCEEDTHLISSCKNRPNCYFKQLARKTQECDMLKKQIESDKDLISDIAKHNYQLFQEYDQLKVEKKQLEQKLKRILEVKKSKCDGIDCAWCTRVDCPREENNQ